MYRVYNIYNKEWEYAANIEHAKLIVGYLLDDLADTFKYIPVNRIIELDSGDCTWIPIELSTTNYTDSIIVFNPFTGVYSISMSIEEAKSLYLHTIEKVKERFGVGIRVEVLSNGITDDYLWSPILYTTDFIDNKYIRNYIT